MPPDEKKKEPPRTLGVAIVYQDGSQVTVGNILRLKAMLALEDEQPDIWEQDADQMSLRTISRLAWHSLPDPKPGFSEWVDEVEDMTVLDATVDVNGNGASPPTRRSRGKQRA